MFQEEVRSILVAITKSPNGELACPTLKDYTLLTERA